MKWQLGGTYADADDTFKMIGRATFRRGSAAFAGIAVAFVCDGDPFAAGVKRIRARRRQHRSRLAKSLIPIGAILTICDEFVSGRAGAGADLRRRRTHRLFPDEFNDLWRYLYAIGGNAEAARLRASITRETIVVYGILGATGIAALIYTARVGSGTRCRNAYELDAIAAFASSAEPSLMGKAAAWLRLPASALIMASLDNGMSLLNVRDFMQDIIKGSIRRRRRA